MALLASQCRNSLFWSKLLPRTTLVLSQNIPDRKIAVRSQKFPEYSLIYDFDKTRTATRFNKIKYTTTIGTAGIVPTLFAVQTLTGYISPHSVTTVATFGLGLIVFLHSCGILFNHVIGYIYLKDDNKTVKLSCVGYWGQRVDIDTDVENIQAVITEYSRFSNPWYQRIRLKNTKKTYKLYNTDSSVLDHKIFTGIFGSLG